MRVKGDGYRDFVTARCSNTAQYLAVSVLAEIEDHCAMQAEENAIEAAASDRGNNWITKPLEGRTLYFSARSGRRADYVFDLPIMHSTSIDEAG
jgi:hypothetical protein